MRHLWLVALLVAACSVGPEGGGDGAGAPSVELPSRAAAEDVAAPDAAPPGDLGGEADAPEDAAIAPDGLVPADVGGEVDAPEDAEAADAPEDAEAADAPGDAEAAPDALPLEDAGGEADAPAEEAPDTQEDAAPADSGPVGPPSPVARLVIAGDSWSSGLVYPTQEALTDLGYPTTVTFQGTAIAGSKASEWVTNHGGKLDALNAALDADPPAEILLLVLGGNDLNAAVNAGMAELPAFLQKPMKQAILDDLQSLVSYVLAPRPHLHVVIVGYDYLHLDFLKLYVDLPGVMQDTYNQLFVEHGLGKLAIAQATERCHYAHNFGLLQWTYGDQPHPPFVLPLFAYPPAFVPKPGTAPGYTPFPGGLPQLPGPLDHLPDGIHPSPAGFRTLIDHTLAQGLENLINHQPWAPSPAPP